MLVVVGLRSTDYGVMSSKCYDRSRDGYLRGIVKAKSPTLWIESEIVPSSNNHARLASS